VGRPGITYDDVARIASKIKQAGETPTIERIRSELKTGSFGTIAQRLREWKERDALQQQYAANHNLPEELLSIVQRLWQAINDNADNRIKKSCAAYQEERDQIQKALNQQRQALTDAEQAARKLASEKEAYHQHTLALEQELQQQNIQKTKTEALLDAANKCADEKENRIQELTKMNSQVQNNLDHYREAVREQRMLDKNEFEHRLSEVTQKNHKLQADWTQILTENTQLKTINQQVTKQYHEQKNACEKNNEQLNTAKAALATAQQELSQKNERLAELKESLVQSEIKLADQASQMLTCEKERAVLAADLQATQRGLQESKFQVKALSHERWILEQEKAKLVADFNRFNEKMCA
jgi:hypothetical protein